MSNPFVARVQSLFARFCKNDVTKSKSSLVERIPFRRPAPGSASSKKLRHARSIVAVIVAYAIATPIARRRGYMIGRNTIVRCRQGHLFTTMWIPGASLKALRLGPLRFQRCPVGRHWTLVVPVKTSSLTEEQRHEAEANRDLRIP